MDTEVAMDLSIKAQNDRVKPKRKVLIRSAEEREQALELCRSGKSRTQVSQLLDIAESTLRGWIKAANANVDVKTPVRNSSHQPSGENINKRKRISSEHEQLPLMPQSGRKKRRIDEDDKENNRNTPNVRIKTSPCGSFSNRKTTKRKRDIMTDHVPEGYEDLCNPNYFALHDYLLHKQMVIGEQLVKCVTSIDK